MKKYNAKNERIKKNLTNFYKNQKAEILKL